MTCYICSNLRPATLDHIESGQYATLFITANELARSAASMSCNECLLLSNALNLRTKQWVRPENSQRLIQLKVAVEQPMQLTYSTENVWLQIYRAQPNTDGGNAADLPDTIGYAPLVPQSSDCDESINVIRSWLEECRGSHTLCRDDRDLVLPTRVIDVTPANIKGDIVRLVETQGVLGEYVAPSYCWGDPAKHSVLKTTREALPRHKGGIPIVSLPQTLKDAVTLTRILQFKYLWVDALCIVQDDEADWAREAGRMKDVYSGSALTIVASRAEGNSKGVFGKQSYHASIPIAYKTARVNVSDDYARDHGNDVLAQDRDDIDPINKRA